jgi:hypothetical protein
MMLAMKGSQTVSVGFFFYFYFGPGTQPRLSRLGSSATACEA